MLEVSKRKIVAFVRGVLLLLVEAPHASFLDWTLDGR